MSATNTRRFSRGRFAPLRNVLPANSEWCTSYESGARTRAAWAARFTLAALAAIPALAVAAINPGDHLTVLVYNHPGLSSAPIVDSTGAIQLPVVGTVHVQGKASKDVALEIKHRLIPFVPYPEVDVADTSETPTLFVAGAPGGVLTYSPGETLAAAIAEVARIVPQNQGTVPAPNATLDRFDRSRVDLRRVAVYRNRALLGTYDMIALRASGDPGPVLFANDTVSLANKPIPVTVLGSVVAPGKAYLWPDEPMSDAVDQAGGVTPTAATGRVVLERSGLAPQSIALGDPALTQSAVAGDVITIPTAPRVTVAGLVAKPGVVSLQNDFTLLSAISTAGGLNKFADIKKVQVLRNGVATKYDIVALTHGDVSQNPTLQDGDTVFVPEGHKIDWSQAFQALSAFNPFIYKL